MNDDNKPDQEDNQVNQDAASEEEKADLDTHPDRRERKASEIFSLQHLRLKDLGALAS
jgi:hypothetical protein